MSVEQPVAEDAGKEPVITVTSSDANVTFDIVNPEAGDLTETVTLYEYFVSVVGG